jgi:histone-lysine N-methyltransferase SETMAR
MLSVLWGTDEFYTVNMMTERHSYNTQYFVSHILEPLMLAVFPGRRRSHSRLLSLHLDNCRVHRSKVSENSLAENYIIRVPHLPYSPDLAPSDFWFFGHMKAALAGQQFPEPGNLLTSIQKLMSGIQRYELELLVDHWIERVQ